jgi:hypothetical protein
MNISKIKVRLMSSACVCFVAGFCVVDSPCQYITAEAEAKIDSLIVAAYQSAVEEYPCKVKASGNPRMIRWQDIEKCLNDAEDRVDWESLYRQIETLRVDGGFLQSDILEAVESALSAHAVPYTRVFKVNNKEALLPLSNTVLKFLPSDSLMDLPVFDKRTKKQIGTFSGVFTYEKSGGLSAANSYKLAFFQYTDMEGDLQTPTVRSLLLDSYGVPWEDASSMPGFRLTSNKLNDKY